MNHYLSRVVLTVMLALGLVACGAEPQSKSESGSESSGVSGEAIQPAVSPTALKPADPVIAEIYNRSCRSCHAQGAARAPLTGDTAAWAPRLEQGMEVLVDHTIDGFQGMPPGGMCFECDRETYRALIEFMAGLEG